MNSPRHHQTYDRIQSNLRKLEKKCSDYHYQQQWRNQLLHQEKFNPYHKPAGTPEGGQFDFAPGNGGSGNTGGGGSEGTGRIVGQGRYKVPLPDDDRWQTVSDKRPATERPPRPEYRPGISPVSHDDWNTIQDTVESRPDISDTKAEVYKNIWAAEGGLKKDPDPDSTAVAGILQDTLDTAKANPKYSDKLKDIKTPSDLKKHPDRVPDLYDAYFDKELNRVGGSEALDKVGNKYASAAMADAVFREGRTGGARVIMEGIRKTDPKLAHEVLPKGKADSVGPDMFDAYSKLARNPATLGPLLDNLAEARKEFRPAETARPDHFRFKKERAEGRGI